jgi:hypothetical protein
MLTVKDDRDFAEVIAARRLARMKAEGGSWFALRTVPGSQLPRREMVTEPTSLGKDGKPRGKGYRLIPSIKYDLSAIERALEEKGFFYYMPAEKRLSRDRRHTNLYKIRRFALMVGYVFVWEPHNWSILESVYGVDSVVRQPDGLALPISWQQIHAIRAVEAEYDAKFDIQSKNARAKLRKQAKNDPRLKKLIGALDMAGTMTVPINSEIFDGGQAA